MGYEYIKVGVLQKLSLIPERYILNFLSIIIISVCTYNSIIIIVHGHIQVQLKKKKISKFIYCTTHRALAYKKNKLYMVEHNSEIKIKLI